MMKNGKSGFVPEDRGGASWNQQACREVDCPVCHRIAGMYCVTANGTYTRAHAARYRAWDQVRIHY